MDSGQDRPKHRIISASSKWLIISTVMFFFLFHFFFCRKSLASVNALMSFQLESCLIFSDSSMVSLVFRYFVVIIIQRYPSKRNL